MACTGESEPRRARETDILLHNFPAMRYYSGHFQRAFRSLSSFAAYLLASFREACRWLMAAGTGGESRARDRLSLIRLEWEAESLHVCVDGSIVKPLSQEHVPTGDTKALSLQRHGDSVEDDAKLES